MTGDSAGVSADSRSSRAAQSLLHIAGRHQARDSDTDKREERDEIVVIGGHGHSGLKLVAELRDAGRDWRRSSVPSTRFGCVLTDNSCSRDSAEGTR
jgi:hypothetical protein